MDTVNRIRRYIDRTLEAEGHISTPEVIVYRLRECHNIEPLLPQKIRRLVCSVSAEHHKTIKIKRLIILLHRLYLIKSIPIRYTHKLKRLSGASYYRAALCKNS